MIQHQVSWCLSWWGVWRNVLKLTRAQLTGAGCWYSTRVFLIHISNVEQCSKLFRQGSSRLLFGSNLAYHDNFIITGRYHWPPSQIKWFAVSVSYLFSHRIHTAVWPERSGVRWLHYCCWHQTTVSLGLRLSSPPLSAVMLEWCTSHQLTLLN